MRFSPCDVFVPPVRCRGKQGSAALVAVVATLVLTVAMSAALADVGEIAVDRTRAQTAADAAALAGLYGGHSSARAIAVRNGVVLTGWSYEPSSAEVVVTVKVDRATATARASGAP